MLLSFGFGFPLALPLFIAGWAAGREARRSSVGGASGAAAAGETLGIIGTIGCLLFVAGCAAIVT
jgi:SNF family Na+-dependent transporter